MDGSQKPPPVAVEDEAKQPDTNSCGQGGQFLYGDQRQGAKPLQEDAFFTYTSPDKHVFVAGIFDGHGGGNGKIAAMVSRDASLRFFKENWKNCQKWSQEHWDETLCKLFTDTHDEIREKFVKNDGDYGVPKSPTPYKLKIDDHDIVRKSNGYPVHGGTTGTVVVVINFPDHKFCITANVGDSDAVLIPEHPYPNGSKWIHLSTDHGPDSSEEYLRVKGLDEKQYPLKLMFVYDKANIFRKYECPLVFRENGTKDPKFVENPWGNELRPTNVRYDPAVYAVTPYGVATDITCIAMTRSLGDFYAHQYGLSCVPSVGFERLDNSKNYTICVATDGVWDCWRYGDFCDFVNELLQSKTIDKATEDILNESIKRAIQNFGVRHFDDASAVVLRSPSVESEANGGMNS